MTCGEILKISGAYAILSCTDCIEGLMVTSCVIMLMISFFGKDAIMSKKSLMPMILFVCIGISVHVILYIHDYFILSKIPDELYNDGLGTVLRKEIIIYLIRCLYILCIFLSAVRSYNNHKIKNGIATLIMTLAFTAYIMLVNEFSIAYFWDDPLTAIEQMRDMSGNLGYSLSFWVIGNAFVMLLIIWLTLYFGMFKRQRTVFIRWKYRVILIIWEIVMIGIHQIPYIPDLTEKQHEKFMGYQLGILIPLTGLVVPLIFITIISRRYAIEKTLIQDNYISAELDYLNQYKKSQEQTRAFRHDIINNLSLLSALYEEENYKDAEEHLGSLLGDVSAMSPKYVTGDEMLDCIVGIKASKMHEEGIDFIVEGMIDGGLGMKPVDVCSVFANAMDNAIEACEKLSEDSNKWIHLSVKKTDRFFAVKLSNTMLPEVDKTVTSKLFAGSERVTTKKDKFLHGFGTQNMKATISRYGGMESVETENGVFKLTILIPRNN